jgi:mono/diheme cytochrome c family protein
MSMRSLGALLASALLLAGAPARGQDLIAGESLYANHCLVCHQQGGTGTLLLARRLGPERALLGAREDLAEDYIRAVVRNGMGGMPWLGRVELPDADLAAIAAYLTRANGGP